MALRSLLASPSDLTLIDAKHNFDWSALQKAIAMSHCFLRRPFLNTLNTTNRMIATHTCTNQNMSLYNQ